jgi:hypothetical protein
VTYKTGFGFDAPIYWTFIQLVTTFHESVSPTCDHTAVIKYSCTPTGLLEAQSPTVIEGVSRL